MSELEKFIKWTEMQVEYVLFFVLLIALIVSAYKRAWIAMVGVIITLSFTAIFVMNPEMLMNLGSWLATKLSR